MTRRNQIVYRRNDRSPQKFSGRGNVEELLQRKGTQIPAPRGGKERFRRLEKG